MNVGPGGPRRRWLWLLAASVLLAGLSALFWWTARPDALGRIRERGFVRIGYAVEAPYAFVTPGGRVSGESAETARLVASRLGWKTRWVQTDFDELIPDLLDGRFDMVAAGLFVTPERARLVRFAAPKLRVRPGLLVPRGNPAGLRSMAQLKELARLRVAVLGGSEEERRLRALGVPHLVTVPDARAGATAVETGAVDVLALSLPTVRTMAGQNHRLQAIAATDPDGVHLVAAAFRPGDRDLVAAWNRAQAQVLGTAEHLREIAAFGFQASDVPETPRTP